MTARSILAFGLNDSRLILRDSFLRMMAVMIVLIALGLRFGLPPLTGYLDGLGLLPGTLGTEPASHYFAGAGLFQPVRRAAAGRVHLRLRGPR